MQDTPTASTNIEQHAQAALALYSAEVRPLLLEHCVGVDALDRQVDILRRALDRRVGVSIGFVGESQVGKSTLINAIVGRNALPHGGIGPLTAQATRVSHGNVNTLQVTFHSERELGHLRLGIESYLHRRGELEGALEPGESAPVDLVVAVEQDLPADPETGEALTQRPRVSRVGEHMLSQASLMLYGRKPPSELPRVALLDGVRGVLSLSRRGATDLAPLAGRIAALQAKLGTSETLTESESFPTRQFNLALKERAADYLSPLVKTLDLRLRSDALRDVTIVDLPGVGVVGDPAARVAEEFVRNEGDALVLVVRNNGITGAIAQLLEGAHVITKLLFGTRGGAPPIQVILVITFLDNVADSRLRERCEEARESETEPPTREQVFAELAREMEAEARRSLGRMLRESEAFHGLPEDLRARREEIVDRLTRSLRVVCAVATDFAKLTYENTPGSAALKDPDATGIPTLRLAITKLAADAAERRQYAIGSALTRFRTQVLEQVGVLSQLIKRTKGTELAEWDRFCDDLTRIASDLKRELATTRVEARSALELGIPKIVGDLCNEAARVAEARLLALTEQSKQINFMTLNAALRRSGVYQQRGLDFPGAISRAFVDVVASVWETKVVRALQVVVENVARSDRKTVSRLCDEGRRRGLGSLADEVLKGQEATLRQEAEGAVAWTEDRLDVLRETVQQALAPAVLQPIDDACKAAIRAGINRGNGARVRIAAEFASGGRIGVRKGLEVAQKLLLSECHQLVLPLTQGFLAAGYDPLGSVLESLTTTRNTEAPERLELQVTLGKLERKLLSGDPAAAEGEALAEPTVTVRTATPPTGTKAALPAGAVGTRPALPPTDDSAGVSKPSGDSDGAMSRIQLRERAEALQAAVHAQISKIVVKPTSTTSTRPLATGSLEVRVTPRQVEPGATGALLSGRLGRSPAWQRQEPKIPTCVPRMTLFAVLDALARPRSLGYAEVARVAGIEARRVTGFVSEAQRVVNLDGQQVLRIDRASERVELDVPLLEQLFGLPPT